MYAVLWLALDFDGSNWQNLVSVALGAGVFLLLPKKWITGLCGGKKGVAAVGSIVNRNRSEMASRLYSVSRVFYDMSDTLRDMESAESGYTPEKLAAEVAKNYCGRCADREGCFAALGGDTSSVLLPMANAVMSRGKATILDMPPFITSRCTKMHNLASVLGSAGEVYRRRTEEAGGVNETQRLMSEQFAGVSLVLDSLARECGEKVSFGEEGEEAIVNELLRHNIVASDVVMSGQGTTATVALTVRAFDAPEGAPRALTLTPEALPALPGETEPPPRIGVSLGMFGRGHFQWMAERGVWAQLRADAMSVIRVLKALCQPKTEGEAGRAASGLGGPIMIFGLFVQVVQTGLWASLGFLRLICVNLALLNLLPLPVLDGGHILFALYAILFRREAPPRVVNLLTNLFVWLLIALFLILIWRDSVRMIVPFFQNLIAG